MRKKIIAGNWKMNKNRQEAKELLELLKDKLNGSEHEVVLCVPYTDLDLAVEALKGTSVKVGAQNMHFEETGAFTGEIGAGMLKEIGVSHVILGHSERRQYFGETDETVNKKLLKALASGLVPIVCVGETLEDRQKNITIELVRQQIKIAFMGVTKEDAAKTVIAYEPIWAIGTGQTATSEQAEEVSKAIRDVVREIYDDSTADSIRIQYGGSVNGKNAKELFGKENIDGGLVGGASLKSEFSEIVNH